MDRRKYYDNRTNKVLPCSLVYLLWRYIHLSLPLLFQL